MKRLLPWFWTNHQMPAREVKRLSASEVDAYLRPAMSSAMSKQAGGQVGR